MLGRKHPTEKLGREPRLEQTQEDTTPGKPSSEKDSFLSKIIRYPKKVTDKFSSLNRNAKLAVILVIILVFSGILAFGISSNNASVSQFENKEETGVVEETPSINAMISLKEGTLQAKNDEGEWEDVQTDFQITENDSLRTVGATSRAVIVFDDGSELRLDADSEVELTTVTAGRIVIRQVSGYSYSRVTEVEARSYVVETADAQYEAEGTAFRTVASGDEQAVEVFHNTVVETKSNTTVQEGEKYIVRSQVRPVDDDTIQRLDIEDIKQDNFMQWNRDLDLNSELFEDKLGFLGDFEAPDIAINDPKPDETILLEPNASEGTVTISGTTERNARLSVQSKSLPDSTEVEVTVNDDGSFTTPVLKAPLGSSVFTFIVRDRVGNTDEINIRYTFQRKSSPITNGQGSYVLGVSQQNDNIVATWSLGSNNAPDGVRLVYTDSASPSYGDALDLSIKKSSQSASLNLDDFEDGKTYYFRICIYDKDDDTCNNYSNEVSVEIDTSD